MIIPRYVVYCIILLLSAAYNSEALSRYSVSRLSLSRPHRLHSINNKISHQWSLHCLDAQQDGLTPGPQETNTDSTPIRPPPATSPENKNIFSKFWSDFNSDDNDDLRTTAFALIFALCLRTFIVEPRFIPSLSMFPTFDVGDQLLVDKVSKFSRGYHRRDVVVFNPPPSYVDLTGNTDALIKRIVAQGGDTVEVKGNRLYVNGVVQDEPYTNELPDYSFGPTVIPAGQFLVLGDNRNHSFDSHIWGPLPENNIIGRAVVKYWPPSRVGVVEGSD